MGVADELVGDDGVIDVDAFRARAAAGLPVGWCRCGGLTDGSVDRGRGLLWLTTRCRACGTERSSPAGKVKPAYGRERRRPGGRAGWLLDVAAELEARRHPTAA